MLRVTAGISIDPQTQCWEWNKYRNKAGYGVISVGSRVDKTKKTMLAHRYSYSVFSDVVLGTTKVLHKCDNRCCINPEHLFLGTQRDNIIDMESKGRSIHPYGENHIRAKLNNGSVMEILHKVSDGQTISSLSREYGVSRPTITSIVNGNTWKHVTDDYLQKCRREAKKKSKESA